MPLRGLRPSDKVLMVKQQIARELFEHAIGDVADDVRERSKHEIERLAAKEGLSVVKVDWLEEWWPWWDPRDHDSGNAFAQPQVSADVALRQTHLSHPCDAVVLRLVRAYEGA